MINKTKFKFKALMLMEMSQSIFFFSLMIYGFFYLPSNNYEVFVIGVLAILNTFLCHKLITILNEQ